MNHLSTLVLGRVRLEKPRQRENFDFRGPEMRRTGEKMLMVRTHVTDAVGIAADRPVLSVVLHCGFFNVNRKLSRV
jgi:hypothetical protein